MQRGELLGNNNIYADISSLCGEASVDDLGKILEAMILQCSRAGVDDWQYCLDSVSNNSSNYLPLLHPNDMHLACFLKGLACCWTIRLQHQDCYLVSKCCITGTKQTAIATHQEEAYLRVWGIWLQKPRYVSQYCSITLLPLLYEVNRPAFNSKHCETHLPCNWSVLETIELMRALPLSLQGSQGFVSHWQ